MFPDPPSDMFCCVRHVLVGRGRSRTELTQTLNGKQNKTQQDVNVQSMVYAYVECDSLRL